MAQNNTHTHPHRPLRLFFSETHSFCSPISFRLFPPRTEAESEGVLSAESLAGLLRLAGLHWDFGRAAFNMLQDGARFMATMTSTTRYKTQQTAGNWGSVSWFDDFQSGGDLGSFAPVFGVHFSLIAAREWL